MSDGSVSEGDAGLRDLHGARRVRRCTSHEKARLPFRLLVVQAASLFELSSELLVVEHPRAVLYLRRHGGDLGVEMAAMDVDGDDRGFGGLQLKQPGRLFDHLRPVENLHAAFRDGAALP